jgi:hypothetical protein
MVARIYKPAKTAMQSGEAGTRRWVLEYEPAEPRVVDPLMGWTGSGDTRQQIRMTFASEKEAIAYARREGIAFELAEPKRRRRRAKAYADNFRFGRRELWTH